MLATKEMAVYCLHVLYHTLIEEPLPACPADIPDIPAPIFVTYKSIVDDSLQGCIGNFAASSLHHQLQEYAAIAALEDTRFAPMTLKGLKKTRCTVSLLHSFEDCLSWDDWEVGKHGIQIQYLRFKATFLPCVAEEQEWDHAETIAALLSKSGYRGKVTGELLQQLKTTRYQVSTASATLKDCSFLE